MCGGRQRSAKIEVPDYRAFDRQFDLQRQEIYRSMTSGNMALQAELQDVLRKQDALKEKIAEQKVAKAERQEDLEAQATRMALLMGTPPPEPVASAPEIGVKDREIETRKGKKSLRIRRTTADKRGKGTGLNIT